MICDKSLDDFGVIFDINCLYLNPLYILKFLSGEIIELLYDLSNVLLKTVSPAGTKKLINQLN